MKKLLRDIGFTSSRCKGYHYTSYDNWLKIQKEGLQGYIIKKEGLDYFFPGGVRGIWLWKKKQSNEANMGSIIFQVSTKNVSKVVLLEVEYAENSIISECISLSHRGIIGDFNYHDNEQSVIVIKDIPKEDIKLIKIWDVPSLLKIK